MTASKSAAGTDDEPIEIRVYSDVVCPWCYIGKRRFERALQQFPGGAFTVHWMPFQLDPTAPRTPSSVIDAYSKKFGGADAAHQIIDRVTTVAASEGLEFRLDRAKRANTFDAHRLLAWAVSDSHQSAAVSDTNKVDRLRLFQRQGELKERLLRAYFCDGIDIADAGRLVSLASEAGFDADEATAVLQNDRYADQVRSDIAHCQELGISSVPTFVIPGRTDADMPFAIPGAQDTDTFVKILSRILARTA